MLTRLRLKAFKSWADTGEVALKPLTAFFGPHGSGKTNLLQAPLLLKQTAESSNRGIVFDFGDGQAPADLGDFSSVIHRHREDSRLSIALDWNVPTPLRIANPDDGGQTLAEDTRLGFTVVARQSPASGFRSDAAGRRVALRRTILQEMGHRVGRTSFGMRRRNARGEYDLLVEGTDFQFVSRMGRSMWPLPAPNKCYGFPGHARLHYQNAGFLTGLESAFEERLQHLHYLGPWRAALRRRYRWTGEQPADVGRAGESAVDALLASRERGETVGRGRTGRRLTLEEYVAQWLRDLEFVHDFRLASLPEDSQVFEVRVSKSADSPEVLATDAGAGLAQVLPVLALCFRAPAGSTVILEQPELGLHPMARSGLADVLVDACQKRGVQILLESHSQRLLRRLQRRLADKTVAEDDVALFHCSASDSHSTLTQLELDRFGNIRNAPEGFFGDEFGEIAAMSLAGLQRRGEPSE